MGYQDENTAKVTIDLETIASPDAAVYLEPVEAPANYKDPLKIAAYCAETFAARVAKAGLEADLCEIAAFGYQHEGFDEASVVTRADLSERQLIELAWDNIGNRAVIGFRTLSFDLPVLIQRSRYLRIDYPSMNLDRYRTPHIDLSERLSFNGKLPMRSLAFYLRRFGIPHADQTTGADVAQMVAEGRWEAVAAHCKADVEGTAALATVLRWLAPVQEMAL